MLTKLRILAAVLFCGGLFGSGFLVATWRAGAHETRVVEQRDLAYRALVKKMVDDANADNERTRIRESELGAAIAAEREQSEGLRREIQDRPVIRKTVAIAVAGECPAPVADVDWMFFAEIYNRAATGAAAGVADDRHAAVSVPVANASF